MNLTDILSGFTIAADEDGASLVCSYCDWWITLGDYTLSEIVDAANAHHYRVHDN